MFVIAGIVVAWQRVKIFSNKKFQKLKLEKKQYKCDNQTEINLDKIWNEQNRSIYQKKGKNKKKQHKKHAKYLSWKKRMEKYELQQQLS
ncbi:UNKNOWN [Stylonychia lemnae]|uniref:Uncharacterized protein n=1 Tax=Stylonychia lemnae TaxID=5949 RepID=A0A077ZWM2_STYLE|nr:UNKNOWN [Stylonychia lemnae]|eukprot:CDW73687.1 UNKNOWN [Stylonychia lemnae]